jgi:hypothetical protein
LHNAAKERAELFIASANANEAFVDLSGSSPTNMLARGISTGDCGLGDGSDSDIAVYEDVGGGGSGVATGICLRKSRMMMGLGGRRAAS